MDNQLITAIATARIIKRKFDARKVHVLDNTTREVSDRCQAYVLATGEEMDDNYQGCEEFITATV
jgi:hypothetical protein